MLGVDRLDMIKGIPQKLLAFEEFLEEHPEWRDKVLLAQIAVPSRTDVPEYQVSCIGQQCQALACIFDVHTVGVKAVSSQGAFTLTHVPRCQASCISQRCGVLSISAFLRRQILEVDAMS